MTDADPDGCDAIGVAQPATESHERIYDMAGQYFPDAYP